MLQTVAGYQANSLSTDGILRLPLALPTITDISSSRENEEIQQDATRILSQEQVTVRELARFVGKAVATVRAFPLVPLHYRALQFQMNAALPAPYLDAGLPSKYNTKVILNEESRVDLRWWKLLDRRMIGSPILPPKPSVLIESDASTKGWGGSTEQSDTNRDRTIQFRNDDSGVFKSKLFSPGLVNMNWFLVAPLLGG